VSDIRETFLSYFDRKGHHIHASSPLIPEGDPTLLFTAAGMVPFKPYFLGVKKGTDRATSCQKCFRTSDIDRVGATIRHLTFFEMLGNFSFGDYFKQDAVHFAWDFLTNVAGLDPQRLYPTVFQDDAEAEDAWKKAGAVHPAARLGAETNFWAMGPTGPCGPCSEIYYDLGPEFGAGSDDVVGGEGDRYIELWNLVFMQSDRQPDGSLKPLPARNIDTGMGLERITMVLEGKPSPFRTALFEPIRAAALGRLDVPEGANPDVETAARIISDHTRAAVMLAAEGIIPSNVERGYVLRRLIRRAARYGRLLGAKEPFLHALVGPALEIFQKAYPELKDARSQIQDTLRAEEERFLDTLEKGERTLRELLDAKPRVLAGPDAFKLYDTYGFPLELTREICSRSGVSVDEEGFKSSQTSAVETARAGWKGSGEALKSDYESIAQENPGMRSEFVGHRKLSTDTQVAWVIRIRAVSGGEAKDSGAGQSLEPGDEGEIILTRTPFYPEGGGQVGDTGVLVDEVTEKLLAVVRDTQRPHPDLIVHRVTAHKVIRPHMRLRAEVDAHRRQTTACHHTATHLLNAALRAVLGPSVRQAGSWVSPDHLRFDFTHPKALSPEQLAEVEKRVNQAIRDDLPVATQELPAAETERLKPVTLLGEKYGDKPRFVLIGRKGFSDPLDRHSLELCGGTHVGSTSEVQSFRIVKEGSVAAGIRRIEAVAGAAIENLRQAEEVKLREQLTEAIKRYIIITSKIQSVSGKPFRDVVRGIPDPETAPIDELRRALDRMNELEKKLRAQLDGMKRESLFQQAKMGQVVLEVRGVKLSVQRFEQAEVQTLRSLADQVKRDMGTGIVFLGSEDEGRLSFVVGVTKDLVEKGFDASAIARAVAQLQNGKAGGRKDFAQGGGPDANWESLVNRVKELVSSTGD